MIDASLENCESHLFGSCWGVFEACIRMLNRFLPDKFVTTECVNGRPLAFLSCLGTKIGRRYNWLTKYLSQMTDRKDEVLNLGNRLSNLKSELKR